MHRTEELPARATCTLIPAGERPVATAPGDLLFLHCPGPIRATIHAGQWLRPALRPWSELTHVACITSTAGDLIEAKFPKVRRGHVSEYHASQYLHVATHLSAEDQAEAVAFLESRVGEPYGVLIDAGIALRMLTPGHGGLFFGRSGTGICSGLGAEMLERGPYVFSGLPAAMCPAELARALHVLPLTPKLKGASR